MFVKPASTVTKIVTSSKSSKRAEVSVDGVEKLAALDAIITALTSRRETLADQIKGDALNNFIDEAVSSGKRPANPKLVEGIGSCGFEMRARSSASALTDEVYELLLAAGVPVEEKTITPSYLAVNPAYASNQEMLEQADKLLSGKPGIPADFIVQTEAVVKKICGAGAIDAVCGTKSTETILELLPHVSVQVLSKLTVTDFNSAVEVALPELAALCGVKLSEEAATTKPAPRKRAAAK